MTVVNPKSISGINSITTGSGSDNLLTIHTSDASSTERVRINSSGDVIVGSGITVSPDGDIFATGVTTSTTFVGALTGNVTGNISGGTVAGSTGTFSGAVSGTTGTFSGDVKTTAATVNVKSGTSINTNSDTSAHGALHKNTNSGEFAVVSGGTGGDNHLTFYTSASAAPTEKVRIDSSGRVLVGHTGSLSEGTGFQVVNTSDNTAEFFAYVASTSGSRLTLTKSRSGTKGTNTVVQSGDKLGEIHFRGADGTGYIRGATISAEVDGTPGTNDMPGRLVFSTTADGANSQSERIRIHSGGQVSIGNASYTTQVHDYQLVVTPNISDNSKGALGLLIDGEHGTGGGAAVDAISLKVLNKFTWNNATHQYGGYFEVAQQLLQPQTGVYSQATGLYSVQKCFVAKLNKNLAAVSTGDSYESIIVTTNSGGDAFHFRGYDDTTEKIRINKNGDIDNSNNSYGSLSDIKLKENIVDANSQWDDIKGLRIRNFNFKDDPDKVKMLGVVAQEAETVSAGLINTNNDIEVDDATGTGTVTGTTKYVKYSILYMKAVKALQEAQTRIETLETKVAALEGG